MRPQRLSPVVLSLFALTSTVFAQGSLTPSGAPAPTMRSLDQVQPRTPIPGGTSGFTISQPGSYYLTGNITVTANNGITISSDNVSLDLNGFTISSTAAVASGFGVSLSGGRTHVAISNGHIRGTTTFSGSFTTGGFVSGIDYTGIPRNIRVDNVSVSGTASYGIDLGTDRSNIITSCTVRTTQQIGLRAAAVSDSAALEVGATAISAVSVSNAIGTLTGAGTAVVVTDPTLASVTAQLGTLQTTANALQGATDSRTRIPGGSTLFTISSSGSYVLTGNITVADGSAISISASNVTLDLNGYTLTCIGGVANGSGIIINGQQTNVTIQNGNIVGGTTYNGSIFASAGFFNGIFASNGAQNLRVEKVNVSNVQRGIYLSNMDESVVVQDCTVNTIAGQGIFAAVIKHCAARTCQSTALQGRVVTGSIGESTSSFGINADNVSDSQGFTSATGVGIPAILSSTALNCIGTATGASGGIFAQSATNCRGVAVSGRGLQAVQSATGCTGTSVSGIGLDAGTANQCYGESTSGTGLVAVYGVTCRGTGTPALNITFRYNMP